MFQTETKQRLAHYLKLFSVGAFEYVRKQLGWSKRSGWTSRGELTGDTQPVSQRSED